MHSELKILAGNIAEKSPLVIQGVKKMLLYNRDHGVQESLDHVKVWNSAMLISEDLTEAMMAYFEKRKAQFRD
jgi:enoyl-CoA hydratase